MSIVFVRFAAPGTAAGAAGPRRGTFSARVAQAMVLFAAAVAASVESTTRNPIRDEKREKKINRRDERTFVARITQTAAAPAAYIILYPVDVAAVARQFRSSN